ncbi:MAG: formyltransferase family protein [Flavobacteriaceae bacterium]|nr:formyltransferase family protein [Flavobacteriaceae bacterium]
MKSENIAVITYYYPHRKTQDVIFGLKTKGYQNVHILALPFVHRENPFQPLFKHRPSDCYSILPDELARNFNYQFRELTANQISEVLNEINAKITLIAGAGILPAELVQNHQIINSHPAYLPEVRGLDALKWAIHFQKKIGVTSHFVVEKADAGYLIDRKEIKILPEDTFHSLAYRQYRTEIEMLIDSIEIIKNQTHFPALEEIGVVHRRMPKSIEKNLLTDFENCKKNQNITN